MRISSPLQIVFLFFLSAFSNTQKIMFKYREICHKISNACFFFFIKKEERKGLNYNTLCKSFPLCYLFFSSIMSYDLYFMQNEFVVVTDIVTLIGEARLYLSESMRKTPWWELSDRPLQTASSPRGRSCLRPSFSCGTPKGG